MLQVVHHDNDLLIVSKPPGLLCVPGLSTPENLYDQVKREHPNARVVHRLDMATSGLVIFALHYEAQKAMGRLFEKRLIHKRYRAVVEGIVTGGGGEIELPLICDWDNRPRQKVCWRHGKPALTRFETCRTDTSRARSEIILHPITGRTHQLRVHMFAIGHGIVGDQLYVQSNPAIITAEPSTRLMLHAEALSFAHPISGRPLAVQSESPF